MSTEAAVEAFITAETWEEAKRIVEAKRDFLLSDAATCVLSGLLEEYRFNEDAVQDLEEHLAILSRCREVGIEAAFAEHSHVTALNSLFERINHLTRRSDMTERVALCHQALDLIAGDEQPEVWAELQTQLASSLIQDPQGDRAVNIEEAVTHCHAALQVYTRETHPTSWAVVQNTLANALRQRLQASRADNIEQAIHHYQQALHVFTHDAYPEQWATIQHNLGQAFQDRFRGDRELNIEQAKNHYKQALQVRTRMKHPTQWAATQLGLGFAYERTGFIEHAIEHYREVLKVRTRESNPEAWASTQCTLADAYGRRMQGDVLTDLHRAVARRMGLESRELLGDKADDFEHAVLHYKQALEVFTAETHPEDWAKIQQNLAVTYAQSNAIEQAIHHYQLALRVYSHAAHPERWALIQNNLGNAYRDRIQGERSTNVDEAISHYRRALTVRTPEAYPRDCRTTSLSLGSLLYEEQRFAEARATLTLAHHAVEAMRDEVTRERARRAVGVESSEIYALLVHCCLLQKDETAAFEFATKGKGRAFVDLLSTMRFDFSAAGTDDPVLAADLRQAQELRQEIDALQAQLTNDARYVANRTDRMALEGLRSYIRLRQDLHALVWEEIVTKYPEVTATQQASGLSTADACNLARDLGATLVEYYRHAGGWCAFVITVERIRHVPLGDVDEQQLIPLLDWLTWIETAEGRHSASWHPPRLWHRAFIAPLRNHLALGSNVVLSPYSWQHLLPLGAAIDAETGRYTCEDYTISFSPSLGALYAVYERTDRQTVAGASPGTEQLLCVAFQGWPPLTNVIPEADTVSSFFSSVTKLYGAAATPESVLSAAADKDVVHFGCHGSFDTRYPEESGIMLANGWLTTQRIITELRLDRARLVTIAACLGGRFDIRRGEEHVGLVQAMMTAGASTVLAGLWPVQDRATRFLLEAFYTALKDGSSPARALQVASQQVRECPEWAHPYYWAAFQVLGFALRPVMGNVMTKGGTQ